MKIIRTSHYKRAQAAPTTLMVTPNESQWGRERHRQFLKTFDVGSHLPTDQRLDNMAMAINTILQSNPPLENEMILESFKEMVNMERRAKVTGDVTTWKQPQYNVKSISDIFSIARPEGDSVKILYSETTGMSGLGKVIWSILGWGPRPTSRRQGFFWNLLQKSGLMQNLEELFVQEWQGILQKAINAGVLENFDMSEWEVDTTTFGRDITVKPLNVQSTTAEPVQPTGPAQNTQPYGEPTEA